MGGRCGRQGRCRTARWRPPLMASQRSWPAPPARRAPSVPPWRAPSGATRPGSPGCAHTCLSGTSPSPPSPRRHQRHQRAPMVLRIMAAPVTSAAALLSAAAEAMGSSPCIVLRWSQEGATACRQQAVPWPEPGPVVRLAAGAPTRPCQPPTCLRTPAGCAAPASTRTDEATRIACCAFVGAQAW